MRVLFYLFKIMDASEDTQVTHRRLRVAIIGLVLVLVAAVVVFHQQSPGSMPTTSSKPLLTTFPSAAPSLSPAPLSKKPGEKSTEAPPAIVPPLSEGKFPYSARINFNDPESVPATGWGDEDDRLREEVLGEAQKRCASRYTTDDASDFNPGIAVRILHFGSPLLPPVGVDAEGSDLNGAKRPFAGVETAPSFSQLELLSKRKKGISKKAGVTASFPTSEYFASYFTPKTLKAGTLHTGSTSVYDNSLSFPLKDGSNRKEGSKVATLLSKRTAASAVAGRWNRFWIYTVDEGGIPTCAGGPPPPGKISLPLVPQPEHYDIALVETSDVVGAVSAAKVAVDRVMYIGYGISEVQFYVRQPSLKYRTCVDLRRSTGVKKGGKDITGKWAPSGRSFTGAISNTTSLKLGQVLDEAATTTGPSDVDLLPGVLGSVSNASVSAKRCAEDIVEGQYCHMCFQTYQLTCEEGGFSGSEPLRSSLPVCTAPLKSYTTVQQYRDRFRYGSWVQMQKGLCDGQYCVVATSTEKTSQVQGLPVGMSPSANQDLRLSFSSSNEGWIWASDVCVMVVFGNVTDLLGRPLTPTSPRPLLTNRWVYGWGSSVMKQPLSNMIENRLKKALFFLPGANPEVAPAFPSLQEEREGTGTPVFMMDIPKHLNSKGAPRKAIAKKLPGFFHYREWDRPIAFTGTGSWWSRFSMSWAGCVSIMGAPTRCASHTQQGMGGTYSKVSKAITHSKMAPDVMLLEFAVWRIPLFDEKQYLDQTAEMFQRLKSLYATKGVSTPLLIYHTSPTPVSQEGYRCPSEVPFPSATSTKAAAAMDTAGLHFKLAHSVWAYDDVVGTGCTGSNPPPSCAALAKTLPNAVEGIQSTVGANPFVVVISRHHMTLPFHFGNDYCHFGIHYGSTEGMCYTGYERKGYGLENCVRKTFVDDMLPEIWFNAIASYQASNPEKPKVAVTDEGL